MSQPPVPHDEHARLRSLHALGALDSEPEASMDALVDAAALTCGAPISLISLIDADRQWFKSNRGLPGITETPREMAFCAHAILQDGIFEVPDATLDPRFADNELVQHAPGIRFYAGATLKLSDGTHAGTLCVIDQRPRRLNETQRKVLRSLAVAVVQALEGSRALREERELRARAASAADALSHSEARFRTLSDALPLGVFAMTKDGACTYANAYWQSVHGVDLAQSLGCRWTSFVHPEDRDAVNAAWVHASETDADFSMEFRVRSPDGSRYVHARTKATADGVGAC